MPRQEAAYKRQHHFVEKGFQFKFILKFCLLILAGIVVSTGLLFLFSRGTLTSSFQDSRLVIKDTAFAMLPITVYVNLVTLGLITLAAIAVTLLISHRLAGPLYRYRRELEEIEKGDLTRIIRLRKNDQLADLGDSLNKMTASLRERISLIQNEVKNVTQAAHMQNAPEELIAQIDELDHKFKDSFRV